MLYTRIKWLALGALLSFAQGIFAQDVWSLERCIQHALAHNLTLKQSQAQAKLAVLSEQQAKAGRLPNVGFNGSFGENFGRSIDPTTNSFSTTAVAFNSFGLSAGTNVYAGGQVHHQIKQANLNAQAAKADAEQMSNNLALQVAQAYLNVLLAEEQALIARQRVGQSERQLANTQKLIDAGTLPLIEQYTVQAQIARESQSVVTASNNVDLAYLSLKQLMMLEPNAELILEKPTFQIPVDAKPETLDLGTLYSTAVQTQPTIRAADLRVQSAQRGIKVAQADYLPQLSIFASMSTNYSSQFLDFKNPIVLGTRLGTAQRIRINDQDVSVQTYSPIVEYNKLPYFDQINQNLGQALGARLSVPIYQNGRVRLNVERARLNVLTAETQQLQAQQQLKNDIQTAIANARAGQRQMDASQKSLEAARTAFTNIEKRFAIGGANTLEMSTAKNNLDIAENDLAVARYNYLFRLKIIDFYQGKALTIQR